MVLEEACGYIEFIIVIYKMADGQLVAAVGRVFSYYGIVPSRGYNTEDLMSPKRTLFSRALELSSFINHIVHTTQVVRRAWALEEKPFRLIFKSFATRHIFWRTAVI